jgi:hypothetical protein
MSKQQAETFFSLSKTIADVEVHEYDMLPCTITGRLSAAGREWDFEINAGATSIWKNQQELRRFGCSDAACDALVLSTPSSQ